MLFLNGWKTASLWMWLLSITLIVAETFAKSDFEPRKFDGWAIGGRKDAKAVLIPIGPVLEQLRKSHLFRDAHELEQHPLAQFLERPNNKHLLQVSSDGYLQATSKSKVMIEAGKHYEISLISLSRNGGEAIYYLDVFAIGKDQRLPLGTAQYKAQSDELFQQTFTFSVEENHPYIGEKIGLTARCRGRNLLGNPSIRITSIHRSGADAIARQLPIVDTLNAEGTHTFITRGYEDFRYLKSSPEAGSLKNTGVPSSALAQFIPQNNAEYTLYDIEGLTLKDGESAALTVHIVDPRAYAGFAVQGQLFVLGRHGNRYKKRDDGSGMNPFRTPDYMMYIARVSKKLGPETIIVVRTGERIDWFTCGRKGSYIIKGLGNAPKLSLFARGKSVMTQFRKGRLKAESLTVLRNFIKAPRHPHGRPNTPGFPDKRTRNSKALAEALSTDLSKPISPSESQAMTAYVAGYNAHGFDTRADPIFSLPDWAIPARIFLITRRKEVLDHLLRIADPAILMRNGFEVNGTQYGVRFGGSYQRYLNLHDFCVFPEGGFRSEADQGGKYFNEQHEYVRDEISHTSDAANARMITPSLAAYCVSLHPEIWDEIVPDGDPCGLGTTYRQRAERYIRELALNYADYKDHKLFNFQTEFIWSNYTAFHRDNDRYLAEREIWEQARRSVKDEKAMTAFLNANPKPMPKERRAGINRFVAATSCAGFAAQAADTFGDEASAKTIDACAEKILKSWFNTFQFYAPGHDGEYLNEPDRWYRAWGYQPNCVNPMARDYDTNTPRGKGQVRGEDRAHMNFTMKSFYMHYESKRYGHIMTPKRMGDLARTFNEMVLPKYNQWRPLPRASKHSNVDPVEGIGGVRIHPLLMFTDFNSKLKKKVIQAMVEGRDERDLLINRVIIAEMRARNHNQIPRSIVK
jgi:hypothetical protein